MKVNVFWFRRDLRIEDNTGLYNALKQDLPVLPLFIFDSNILSELPKTDARVNFIYQQLINLYNTLGKHKSSILVMQGNPIEVWKNLVNTFEINAVFLNEDYEPYARERDEQVTGLLHKNNIKVHTFKDQVIFATTDILKDNGEPYTVFTAYKNRWFENLKPEHTEKKKSAEISNYLEKQFPFPSLSDIDFCESTLAVKPFQISDLSDYNESRNFPYQDSTSYLSPHLRFGRVSVREIFRRVPAQNISFRSELVWREFFMQILWHFPEVVTNNFKRKYDGLEWRNKQDDFERWCNGTTGYPMVDAGMRQLNATGYMHNRVRMVTAGFLCKHLLIDWRWGEAYFAEKLLDYELSSNNGNWQWAAGTGCDAAPYFRIFNPTEQLRKFDKEHRYIKKWLPEFNTASYPEPMIEHTFARNRALEVYKKGISQH